MRVLVVNSGSSSLKLRIVIDEEVAARADLPAVDSVDDAAVHEAVVGLGHFDAVGHRVVHGGRSYTDPVRVDDNVRRELERLAALAPLHQPPALRAMDIVADLAPDVPSVACFDTAFHARLPPSASTYAVPRHWREDLGVRKYGFHGIAHASTARRAAELLGPLTPARVISCHLGAGASLAAVVDGRCVDTTMGFTPLDGLVMATRSGAVDPGLVLWLQLRHGMRAEDVRDALETRSGLVGLAGTADMRALLERAETADPDAGLALDVYLHRLRTGIAAMAAAAGGVDAVVFSGGVGEHAADIRERAVAGLEFLDVGIDGARNASVAGESEITGGGRVRVFVIPASEDLEIARAVRALLRHP